MLTSKSAALAFTCFAIGFLALGAVRAHADEGLLPPNSRACTDQVRSNHGAFIYGRFSSSQPPTRTLWMSSTPDGEPTEVLPDTPPPEGIFYFRACVTSVSAPVFYTMFVLPNASATDFTYDIGRHTAELGPDGEVCGSFGVDQDRRVGESDVPVLWTVLTFDGDGALLGETSSFTGDFVDDVITLSGQAAYFEICASTRSGETATLSFDVLQH